MWELSRVIGGPVLDPAGRPLGRLADLTVRLDSGPGGHRVHRLLVDRRGARMLVPWDDVQTLRGGRAVLRSGDIDAYRIGAPAGALEPDEILLGRDVLDTQVVDVVGQRLARVAEVLLVRGRDCDLEVAGVEVGFGAVLRRLGLGVLAGGRRADAVAWSDLHLTSERGHAVQVSTPRAAVHRLDPRALAALISRVGADAAAEILAARGPSVAEQALRATHPDLRARLRRAMPAPRPLLRSRVFQRRHLNWPTA